CRRRRCPRSRAATGWTSEVPLTLAVFHGRLGHPVVGAGGAALGEPRGRHLGDDLFDGDRGGFDRAGARAVADGPVADGQLTDLFARPRTAPGALGQQHPVAQVHLALVRVVDRRQFDLLAGDVVPDVGLGPVGQREDADLLARAVPAVVEVPQLGPLTPRLPLPESVAQAEDPLLSPGAFLVAAAA